jgi:intein-encoded DNA endonuclease-like protein
MTELQKLELLATVQKLKSVLPKHSGYTKAVRAILKDRGIDVSLHTIYQTVYGNYTNVNVANAFVEYANGFIERENELMVLVSDNIKKTRELIEVSMRNVYFNNIYFGISI